MDDDGLITIELCKMNLISQKWQLVMNEVLSLWIDGLVPKHNKLSRKSTRKQMKKLILHQTSQPINEEDALML